MGINDALAKGYNLAGQANVLASVLPLPKSMQDGLTKLFGGSKMAASTNPDVRSVNEFRSFLYKKNGLARQNRFYVTITAPKVMGGRTEDARDISFLAESTNLPGVSLASTEVRRIGYGPTERFPYAPIFVDTNMSFLGDNTGTVHNFFTEWMNSVLRFDSHHLEATGRTGLDSYEVEYKDQYCVDIKITCVDEMNQKIMQFTLVDAWPIFLGDVGLGWGAVDDVMRIPVTFTFVRWYKEDIDVSGLLKEGGKSSLTTIQKLIKLGSAIQTLSTITKPNSVADVINVVNNSKIAVGGLRGLI